MPTSSTPSSSAPANIRMPLPRCRRLQLGKHVYCEKPLTYNVWEARVIREAAAKAERRHANGDADSRRRQLSPRGRTDPDRRDRRRSAKSTSGCRGPGAGKERGGRRDGTGTSSYVAGSTRRRPIRFQQISTGISGSDPRQRGRFNNVYFPGPKWYRWWDFGNGTMSDLGSHWIDLPFWALKLDHPLTIEAQGPQPHPEIAPASMQVTYEYGPRGDMPPVRLTWYQGANKPEIWQAAAIPQWDNGVLFIGENEGCCSPTTASTCLAARRQIRGFRPSGAVHSQIARPSCGMDSRLQDGRPDDLQLRVRRLADRSESSRQRRLSRREKNCEWDPQTLQATNAPEAEPFIHREYRKGWKLI